MIITKTPLRVSFFGGGTDFPEYFSRNGGAVLGTAIDKYVYLSVMRFPSELFDYTVRLAYRKVECVSDVAKIEHAPFREILRHCGIEKNVEINVAADLPSFSGLGTSSSFTVGLIKALNAYEGRHISALELATQAIKIEREVLHEAVGCQDQTFAAFGGFNVIQFSGPDRINVERVVIGHDRLTELDGCLMMFFTGLTRRAQEVEKSKLKNLAAIQESLGRMLRLVDEAHALLTSNRSLSEFGILLDRTWKEKRSLDAAVSNPQIDHMYDVAMKAGALGGKLLGAGGGGFLLFYVPIERQPRVRAALADYHEIEFSINAPGSSVIHS
jgi:D-glycero-alpha-D-manno-heptose-7-phosphate kinase